MSNGNRVDVYLICNAAFHDTNFARLELLKLLAENDDLFVRVGEDYSDIKAIQGSQLLITYTCNLCPTEAEQEGLKEFLAGGGKWFALHGTNAIIEFVGEMQEVDGVKIPGKADTPNKAPLMMELLGSRFVAHPPNQTIQVTVTDSSHPLVKGIDDFETYDEPYYSDYADTIETLLEARYSGKSEGYVQENWGADNDEPRPQLYLHPYGDGSVLYLALGHCRGKFDMQPFMEIAPVERCSWELPVYYELLRRGIKWGAGAL